MLRARTENSTAGRVDLYAGRTGRSINSRTTKRPFTRDELDEIVPDHPLLAAGLVLRNIFKQPRPSGSRTGWAFGEKTNGWSATMPGGPPAGFARPECAKSLENFPAAVSNRCEASTVAYDQDLNRSGLTTFGSAGCEADLLPIYRRLADSGKLTVRVFCITGVWHRQPARRRSERAPPADFADEAVSGDELHRQHLFR
jgi:predicted amidohydrolase YtcJ